MFNHHMKILFAYCDPAGIVFYPRYFEMLNQTVEAWCDEHLGYGFAKMHGPDGKGIPAKAMSAQYHAPSFHGEYLEYRLRVEKVGKTSVSLAVDAYCEDQLRVNFTLTLVYFDKQTGKSEPWPVGLKEKLLEDYEENVNA